MIPRMFISDFIPALGVLLLLLLPLTSLTAQDTDEEDGTEREIAGLNQDAAPGFFIAPHPSVTRSGHLVVAATINAAANDIRAFRMPFAVGYGIARYSQAFARFENGSNTEGTERDRVVVGLRLFLGTPLGLHLGIEGYGSSISEWPEGLPQRSGLGGGLRMMIARSLPIGMVLSVHGGAGKDPFTPMTLHTGAAVAKSVFEQTLVGIEADWEGSSKKDYRSTLAAGLRMFLFEHLQISIAYQFVNISGAASTLLIGGLAFSSDILSTSGSGHANELPPELPDLDEMDTPVNDQ